MLTDYKSIPRVIDNAINSVKNGISSKFEGIESIVSGIVIGSNRQPTLAYAGLGSRLEAGPTQGLYGKAPASIDNYMKDSNTPRTVASNSNAREWVYRLFNF